MTVITIFTIAGVKVVDDPANKLYPMPMNAGDPPVLYLHRLTRPPEPPIPSSLYHFIHMTVPFITSITITITITVNKFEKDAFYLITH